MTLAKAHFIMQKAIICCIYNYCPFFPEKLNRKIFVSDWIREIETDMFVDLRTVDRIKY